jgi:spermidine synthase
MDPIPLELIDKADVPGGGQLRLLRCGHDFSIHCGEDELMGSQSYVSEKALATLAVDRMGDRRTDVLIGGLGMGFTLGAALGALPATTSVIVAELVPEVVGWARGPLAHVFADHLTDPRVTIRIDDVHDVIERSPQGFDAILLDVDNGPDGFIRDANDRLYCNWGIQSAFDALRPDGVLAVWSAYEDAAFVARLCNVGFDVETIEVPDQMTRTRKSYTVWIASKHASAT